MKNSLIVKINTEAEAGEAIVNVSKPEDIPVPETKEEWSKMLLDDMATLCEALATIIGLTDDNGIRSKEESMRLCVEHLENRLSDKENTEDDEDTNEKEV